MVDDVRRELREELEASGYRLEPNIVSEDMTVEEVDKILRNNELKVIKVSKSEQ